MMMMMNKGEETDGRRRAETPKLWKTLLLTNASKEKVLMSFKKDGESTHSKWGHTLAYILQYCIENKIPFVLEGDSSLGYYIRRKLPSEIKTGQLLSYREWLQEKGKDKVNAG